MQRLFALSLCAGLLTVSQAALADDQPLPVYSWDRALRQAAEKHRSIQQAEAQLHRAEAILRQTRAPSLPSLTANAIYTRLDDDRKLGERVVSAKDQINANLLLTVPIWAPSRWAQWSQATDSVDLAYAVVTDARRQILIQTGRTYLQVITQKKQVEVAERSVRVAQEHVDYIKKRREAGGGSLRDEVRAEQEKAVAETQLANARLFLRQNQEMLGLLIGEENPVDTADRVNLEAPNDSSEQDSLRRSDIRTLEYKMRAAEHRVKDGWRDYSPTLTANFQPFYQNPASLTQPTFGWQAQLVLTVPIYDGGVRPGQQAEREAQLNEARLGYDQAKSQARTEYRIAREEIKRAQESTDAAKRAAELAHKSLDMSKEAYELGASNNIEVIDAERRARDADSALALAENSLMQAKMDLWFASGGMPQIKQPVFPPE